jgi:Transposase IS66 family
VDRTDSATAAKRLSVSAFCRGRGFSGQALYYSRKRLSGRARVRFASVAADAAPTTGASPMELLLASGDRLRIAPGPDALTLRTVLNILRETCMMHLPASVRVYRRSAGNDCASLRSCLRGEDPRLLWEREARPMLNRLHENLLTIREQVPPKSEAGQAIAYALKNWTALTRYRSDGDLLIDNTGTVRSLRSFAVGRNYAHVYIIVTTGRFSEATKGQDAAVLRSFVTSCELVKVDPFA